MGFGTDAIHAGQSPDPTTGAIMTPVYLNSTYAQSAPGEVIDGYDYARTKHPTRTALEANLAALEGARHGFCFASGCAATNTLLSLLKQGDHVVAGRDLYGGSYRLFVKVFEKFGVEFSFINVQNIAELKPAIRPNTKLLWFETPSNPQLAITDIEAASTVAHQHGVKVCVDNTFATPFLQQPLKLGADFVVHSTTKYLGGHSDVVGGAVLLNDEGDAQRMRFMQNSIGGVPGALDCFLLLRSTKTLHVRMERHCENAMKIAKHLRGHADVDAVYYPGLEEFPGHKLAKKQMRDFGGMISFELRGGLEQGRRFCSATKIFTLAESLGGVESLLCHPTSMTHASIPPAERAKSGLKDGLIRLSVGIEDCEDLIEDLEQAITASRKGANVPKRETCASGL